MESWRITYIKWVLESTEMEAVRSVNLKSPNSEKRVPKRTDGNKRHHYKDGENNNSLCTCKWNVMTNNKLSKQALH